jgi:hypothetical protein
MIICATAIVIANGLVQVFAQIRTENNIISGNSSLLVKEGIALGRLGNYTGAILYYDKALAIDSHDVNALYHKGNTLDVTILKL